MRYTTRAGCFPFTVKIMKFFDSLLRKRLFKSGELDTTQLNRCLNTWDLTALGLGGTLGAGVHVLVGAVAVNIAGPSVVISFIVAAMAAMFAVYGHVSKVLCIVVESLWVQIVKQLFYTLHPALCFAELSARIPKAGSSYIYTYVVLGEAAGFLTGWIAMFELMFGTASIARGLSLHIDALYDNTISDWCKANTPIIVPWLGSYFDVLAFGLVVVIGAIGGIGVRQNSILINVFTVVNMLVISFIIIAGAIKDTTNWSLPAGVVPIGFGNGGFFPYGIWGVIKGAAICFYGYVGFDAITYTGEEVKEPRRAIPLSIMIVTGISTLTYCGVAIVITLMVPYFLQETASTVSAVFAQVGWEWARWVVAIGGVFGISASLLSGLYSLSRLLYAKASDHLLCRSLSQVSSGRKSPIMATVVAVLVIAGLSSLIELSQLIMTLCVGTLLSYSAVAVCVIILRYGSQTIPFSTDSGWLGQIFGLGCKNNPSTLSCKIAYVTTFLFVCTCLSSALTSLYMDLPLIPLSVLHGALILFFTIIYLQPVSRDESLYQTPMVPLIPLLSVYINIHLMVHIGSHTWIRIIIWILIGVPVYLLFFFYSKTDKTYDVNSMEVNITSNKNNSNGESNVQIVLEPTTVKVKRVHSNRAIITEEIPTQQAIIDYSAEKEAKVIDFLDQVLQAEEDTYIEVIDIPDEDTILCNNVIDEREKFPRTNKSLSQLSEAGSDASISTVLSKYDVVAQIHREDLPKANMMSFVTESTEQIAEYDTVDVTESNLHIYENYPIEINDTNIINGHGLNESDTNSRTDESGYSDTIDLNNSIELFEDKEAVIRIPSPPPMDERYFASPILNKSFTISAKSSIKPILEDHEIEKMRVSVNSNGSLDDNNIVFGSMRQQKFMSKLNNILQTKMTNPIEEVQPEQKRHSTGNLENETKSHYERPKTTELPDLMKEIVLKDLSRLKTVTVEQNIKQNDQPNDITMTRQDLKSKLESIFATGGPKPFKPSGSSKTETSEEVYQTDHLNTEDHIIYKAPKFEKNDTLKRQKTKFSEVLNSIKKNFPAKDDMTSDEETF